MTLHPLLILLREAGNGGEPPLGKHDRGAASRSPVALFILLEQGGNAISVRLATPAAAPRSQRCLLYQVRFNIAPAGSAVTALPLEQSKIAMGAAARCLPAASEMGARLWPLDPILSYLTQPATLCQ